ncbi:uncharacterized protein shoc1 [Menidia menidia]
MKVTMNLLALPTPYLSGSSAQYPHDGELPDISYRSPWIRGKVISSCTLSVSGSVLDDLWRVKQPSPSLERYLVENDQEVIPSSNPESLKESDLDQNVCLLKKPHINDRCEESFVKLTAGQMKEGNTNKDFLMPDELVPSDHLLQLKRHLPTLKTILSRLRTLHVADPLLSSAGIRISDDATFSCFRKRASYEKPHDMDTISSQPRENIQEQFVKESVLEEKLLNHWTSSFQFWMCWISLKVRLRWECFFYKQASCIQTNQGINCNSFGILLESLANRSTDIFQYDVPQEKGKDSKMTGVLMEPEFAGPLLPAAEMELDVTLSPAPDKRPAHICVSTSQLLQEDASPISGLPLLSAKTQKELKVELWKSEKNLMFVAAFLLSEPQMYEPASDFQPLREALTAIRLEKEEVVTAVDSLNVQVDPRVSQGLNCRCEFTVNSKSKLSPTREEEKEVFTKLLPEDVEGESRIRARTVYFMCNRFSPLISDRSPLLDLHEETTVDRSEITFISHTVTTNLTRKETAAIISIEEEISEKRTSAHTNNRTGECDWKVEPCVITPVLNTRVTPTSRHEVFKRHQTKNDLDPLSTFMMLRSQQKPPVAAAHQSSDTTTEESRQIAQKELQPSSERLQMSDRRAEYTDIAVVGEASRDLKPAAQWRSKPLDLPVSVSEPQDRQTLRVVQVQATASQLHVYCELLAFARPYLSSAREMGLNFQKSVDFSCLAPDQTHFLLKQQERALCRAPAQSADLVRDQEKLFNQAALIHVLVSFKELLLKCDISPALEYLTEAAKGCAEQSLKQLLKRLQVILYLSRKKQEPNLKLLELQRLLAEWLRSRTGHDKAKVLVIHSVDSEDSRSEISCSLNQVTGLDVAPVCLDEGQKQLNGASVVNSVGSSDCALVCERHIGPDFPWSCFSLVVELDRPGQSPWSRVCRERSLSHLSFSTTISDSECAPWCLEDHVPYVLFVTEGLLNCPQLLQTLESGFNVTVLERNHPPTLQGLGGISNYALITVDESTVIIIQEQEELCQERASESLVMRLAALSLQYSCCWLILHCPDSRGGGFSSEAFNNLVLVYSSLVLFGGKSENLNVKVLIVSEVLEMANFINHICFTALMSSDSDPLSYLTRDWLTVMPSQEEESLSLFPSINPLVGQLMLKRARSLPWLLGAPLPQLEDLLPEVPHKVLKLFSDITSLYRTDSGPSETNGDAGLWTPSGDCEPLSGDHSVSPLFGAAPGGADFCQQASQSTDFKLDLKCPFEGPDVDIQRHWTREEPKGPAWRSKARATGRVVERVSDEWTPMPPQRDFTFHQHLPGSPLKLDFSPVLQPSDHSRRSLLPPAGRDLLHPLDQLSPALDVLWGHGQRESGVSFRGADMRAVPGGSGCWRGLERKRSGEAAGVVGPVLKPVKRGKLSYERVPGRSDGQTRLRLF